MTDLGSFYDSQQAIKAMQMWGMEQYPYAQTAGVKGEAAMPPFHPFAFAQSLQSIAMGHERVSPPTSQHKKKPNPVPPELKDEAYYERRKRNNESARKSREARRHKEDHTQHAVHALQQENLRLKAEVHMLKHELEQIRYAMLQSQQMHMAQQQQQPVPAATHMHMA